MDRREALRRSALLMGGVIFAPSAIGVLNGCQARPGVDWSPEHLDRSQARLITILVDMIIPDTDTPGAVEAGVPAFVEEMIFVAYNEDARQEFISGLEAFENSVLEEHGSSYADLEPEVQFQVADSQNRRAVGGEHTDDQAAQFFLVMKELTVMGYFTSEIGATQTLRYEKVPGRYDACIPFDEVGKTWAT